MCEPWGLYGSSASVPSGACDPMIHEQLPSSLCHQPTPNSLIILEPAVTIGCAEKKGPAREKAGRRRQWRGEQLPPDPKMAQREFQTAAVLSPTNSLAAVFQSVTLMLLLPVFQQNYHKGTKA